MILFGCHLQSETSVYVTNGCFWSNQNFGNTFIAAIIVTYVFNVDA